ncbi:MAG TPA: nodulation protein NfeD [Candidatus Limnocylindrales bacterium]|nr:nodulation protein NfeD [Candidatus Limnocylindrales bacterium]
MNHRLDRGRSVIAAALAFSGVLLLAVPASTATRDSVVVLPTTGVVDPIMKEYVTGALKSAGDNGARAVVIRLNTPGGSLDATQQIVSAILESSVPVIVWVAPSGGFAASAGTFITLSANLAYMAPGTRIGAASPIDSSGQDIPGTLGEKVKNDAIAWVTSIAQVRHRPVDWAVSTVASARSSPANEAVALGAVDGIASTIDDVVRQANGKVIQVKGVDRVLDLTGAPISEQPINPFQGILHLLADPNIALILFTIGFYGLLFEVQNPNFVTGILGAVAIILAFIGFGSLPLNLAGLILIGIGLLLFGLEPTVTSHGLLTVGGVVCFVLGASALYTESGPFEPDVSVAFPLIVVMTTTSAAFAILITITAIRTRRMPAPSMLAPAQVAVGTLGQVRRPLEPFGSIYADGEEWTARAVDDRTLPRGAAVRVVRTDGLTLVVEPDPSGLP